MLPLVGAEADAPGAEAELLGDPLVLPTDPEAVGAGALLAPLEEALPLLSVAEEDEDSAALEPEEAAVLEPAAADDEEAEPVSRARAFVRKLPQD